MPKRPTLESEYGETLIAKYFATSTGRAQLITEAMKWAQNDLDFIRVKRRLSGASRMQTWIGRLERFQGHLDGTEVFDRTRLLSLLSDLRVLRDELQNKEHPYR